MRTLLSQPLALPARRLVGMKPLSERDENWRHWRHWISNSFLVGMKPLSERDENNKKIKKIKRQTA